MIFESIHAAGRPVPATSHMGLRGAQGLAGFFQKPEQSLETSRKGFYDRKASELLAFASSWTYSNIGAYAYAMANHGLTNNDSVSITLTNDALFVDTSAFILQSQSKNVVIISFRGTKVRGTINWLTDATARRESFLSAGEVHGGFHRAIRAIWPILRPLLLAAAERRSICEELEHQKRIWLKSCGDTAPHPFPANEPTRTEEEASATAEGLPAPATKGGVRPNARPACAPVANNPPAFYITGHSLGGALAVLAGAILHRDDDFSTRFGSAVRGIYTYGQPMVGDSTFAREHKDNIGTILFRHVYERDIVPRLPPITMGRFEHIGREYHSTETGWALKTEPVRRTLTAGLSNIIGIAAWLTQDVLPIRWLRLPFSWGHHSPINYMRASMIADPGAEFDPFAPTV
ncbi:lipase family protein [Sorangium sp. So ce367]|uniref:lipase family protein n=1 Tax=Sorangium sp. So ce367 TaxID=3133305 RepID=UPI003F6033A6